MSRALILVITMAAFCSTAAGQTATGILQGFVSDASGAAVPDAVVTVENQRTGVKHTLTTNAEGRFVQPFLIPGEYRLTVEKPGFQKHVATDIRVDVQQTVALEIALKLGEVSTAVEVSAALTQLSTAA
ncbi:MAG: TonB-dependent receptor, partial [Acidobacteria bacterium]